MLVHQRVPQWLGNQKWVCLKMSSVPHCTQWFCWSLSLLNGYFIGKINPIFRQPIGLWTYKVVPRVESCITTNINQHVYRVYRAARRLGRTEATCSPVYYQTWIALCATVNWPRRPAMGSLVSSVPPRFAGYKRWLSSHWSTMSTRSAGNGQ